MPAPSLTAPSTGNYRIGKGVVSFKKEGEPDFTHLGNCIEAVITPAVETLEHFSSMEGVRTKDLEVVLEKAGTAKLTLEEFTAYNLGLMVLGTVDEAAAGGPTIEIFSESEIIGELKIEGTNDVGPRVNAHLYRVSVKPTGDLGFIEDEWGNMEIEMEMMVSDVEGPTKGKFGVLQITNIPGVS
jgi:hypothetical protein